MAAAPPIRPDAPTAPAHLRRGLATVATLLAAVVAGFADDARAASAKPTHRLTLAGAATEPARPGVAPREPACLLRVSLRRLTTSPRPGSADLTLEFADPRQGRHGSLVGSVRLDLDDTGAKPAAVRIDGIGCDELRPLNLHFACTTADGRCPPGTRVRLKNFERLEIAEDVLAFD